MSDTTNPKDALGDKKVNLALVPPASIIHEAMAMESGAKKFGAYNWREKKVRTMVYIAAGLRHTLEYLDGADYSTDTDPPVHHLAHAKACFGIVLDAMETGNLIDDRPKKSEAATRLVSRTGEGFRGVIIDGPEITTYPEGWDRQSPPASYGLPITTCQVGDCSWWGRPEEFDGHYEENHSDDWAKDHPKKQSRNGVSLRWYK